MAKQATSKFDDETRKQIRAANAVTREAKETHWLTWTARFRRHRDRCHVCASGNPLTGPHCAEGRQLRNNTIDEMCGVRPERTQAAVTGAQ